MAAQQSQLAVAFAAAVTELVTVERKNIVVLTEIARDALHTEPASAPSLAGLITNRVLQAPASQKLPVLYLLDSVSKTVGEPYKTLFAPSLAEVFMCTWQAGGPGLHRPLDKLLATWVGIFPQPLLADIHSRLAALRAAAAPLQVQPPAAAAPGTGYVSSGGGAYGYAAAAPQPVAQPGYALQPAVQQLQPVVPAAGYTMQPPAAPTPFQQQVAQPQLQPQAAGFGGYPPLSQPQLQPTGYYQQPQLQQPQPYLAPEQPYLAPAQAQSQQQPQINVPDLLSSLMTAGLLAPPGAAPAAAAAPLGLPPSGSGGQLATPPYQQPPTAAVTATPEREVPATTRFTPERLKEPNPSAVARLLRRTEATKSRFLDRKFLRRQQKQAGSSAVRGSRMWYLNLDTWMASTVGQAGTAAAGGVGGQGALGAAAAARLDPQSFSVPVDDSQTHCALSGEQFEQFWDEGHQEWRYRGAKVLDVEEAASYGLQEGAIVLVSALGNPAGAPGDGPGVLSELAAQREIADDLAAAAVAAEAGAVAAAAEVGGVVVKQEEKLDVKHPLDVAALAALAAAEGVGLPLDKRQRVA